MAKRLPGKGGRPTSIDATKRVGIRLPEVEHAMLAQVVDQSPARSVSEWIRLQIARAFEELLTPADADSGGDLPAGYEAEAKAAQELKYRGIDLDEVPSILNSERELRRLGLVSKRAALRSLHELHEEERELRSIDGLLKERGIGAAELPEIMRKPKELRRLGFNKMKKALARYLVEIAAEEQDED